tara:strand:+ start:1437 stop:1778 length:342 start_codon:yes stop_codon:yes gene_type:complete
MERIVAKPEWGLKRFCPSCGAAFYDLNKSLIECPKCNSTFEPEQLTRLKRSRSVPPETKAAVAETKAGDVDDEAVVVEDDTDDEAVLEDASDLGGEDVIEVVVDSPEGKKEDV